MRRQRQLQTTAQGHALQRRDHGFAAGGDKLGNIARPGRLPRLAKLADIGARAEIAAVSVKHDGLHRRIPVRGLQGLVQLLAQRVVQRVQRRMTQTKNQDSVLLRGVDAVVFDGRHVGIRVGWIQSSADAARLAPSRARWSSCDPKAVSQQSSLR
ncbi:hypothetical protein D3C71_1395420 [compost metagenome]